jgi:fructose-1,6-bisphosphatase
MEFIANEIFVSNLRPVVPSMVSEEEESIIYGDLLYDQKGVTNSSSPLPPTSSFHVAFDPLDGSSNFDANVPIGSIFGIYSQSKERRGYDNRDDDDDNTDINSKIHRTTTITNDTSTRFWLSSSTPRSTLLAAG